MAGALPVPQVERCLSAVYVVFHLFGDESLVGRQVEVVASAAVFVGAVVLEGQAAVVGCACEGTQAEGLRFQFRHFRESVAVVVVAVAMPVLAIYCETYLVVHAHHGCVERRVVVQSAAYAY